jgi:hypothetical protein
MAKGVLTGILVLVLVVGAVGWLTGQPVTPTAAAKKYAAPASHPNAKDWTLTVGPDPCQVRENGKDVPVAVIERGKHSIRYQSDSGQPLSIVFHAPANYPKASAPFKKMTTAGTDGAGKLWKLVCEKPNVCSTGPAVKGSQGGYWKTDQILAGKKCDAGIIIQP